MENKGTEQEGIIDKLFNLTTKDTNFQDLANIFHILREEINGKV